MFITGNNSDTGIRNWAMASAASLFLPEPMYNGDSEET